MMDLILKNKIKKMEEDLKLEKLRNRVLFEKLESVHTNLSEVRGQIHQDFKLVNSIFKYLVPEQIPHVTGFSFSSIYRIGSEKNGDYLDVFEHQDKLKFGFLLCSSHNPGLSALILGIMLKISKKMNKFVDSLPHELVDQIFQDILSVEGEGPLPDFLMGYVNKRTYKMHLHSRGKVRAYSQSSQGKMIRMNQLKSPLTESLEFQLYGGDRWVFLTEGFFEMAEAMGFSDDVVLDCVHNNNNDINSVHDLRNEILYNFEKKYGKESPTHDHSILILEVHEPKLRLA